MSIHSSCIFEYQNKNLLDQEKVEKVYAYLQDSQQLPMNNSELKNLQSLESPVSKDFGALETSATPGVFNPESSKAMHPSEDTRSHKSKWLSFSDVQQFFVGDFIYSDSLDCSPLGNASSVDLTSTSDERSQVENIFSEVFRQFDLVFEFIPEESCQVPNKILRRSIQSYSLNKNQAQIDFQEAIHIQLEASCSFKLQILLRIGGFEQAVATFKILEKTAASMRNDLIYFVIDTKRTDFQNIFLQSCTIQHDYLQNLLQKRYKLLGLGDELAQVKSLREIRGLYLQLSKSNTGSRKIQKLLKISSDQEIKRFVEELGPKLGTQVVTDPYGNYVFQQLIETCSLEQRLKLIQQISPSIGDIVQTKTGTFAMQRLLEKIATPEELQLILSGLEGKQIELSCHQQGTHFMQKLLSHFVLDSLYSLLLTHLQKLCLDQHGLVVIKTLMNMTYLSDWKYYILNGILCNFDVFFHHQYGHYIIRHAFLVYGEYQCYNLKQQILLYLADAGTNKYASSVIQKLITQYCEDFTGEVLNALNQDRELLIALLDQKTGSFVIHRLLESGKAGQKGWLDSMIKANIKYLRSNGSKCKWSRFYGLKY